jgi:Trehalose receptor
MMTVLFASANINEAAKKPLIYIQNVPSRYWTLDVIKNKMSFSLRNLTFFFQSLKLKRLYDTIDVEAPTLAFSGKQFFYITKGLILAVI